MRLLAKTGLALAAIVMLVVAAVAVRTVTWRPPSAVDAAAAALATAPPIDLDRAAKHRAGMGFFRDRRPQLYGRLVEDV